MNWLDEHTSCYKNIKDVRGESATFRQMLWEFTAKEIIAIMKLRNTGPDAPDYEAIKKEVKSILPLFSPSALLATRAAGKIKILKRLGLVQMDFDYAAINGRNIEDLKKAVFALPFVALCSLSVSGRGFYALIAIAEPEKQKEYAEHLFEWFKYYGLQPDTTKGRNPHDLRYKSFDWNLLIRENPEPLTVNHFKVTPKKQVKATAPVSESDISKVKRYTSAIEALQLDFCHDYSTWVNMGLALANSLKECGREHFHICSKYYPNYDYDQTDRKYNSFLHGANGSVTLGTFFHECHKHNLDAWIDFSTAINNN